MNKRGKVISNYLIIFSLVLTLFLMCFVLASPSVLLEDGTSSVNVNEDEGMLYNISVNTTSGDWDNVTIVNITLPGVFTFYSGYNGTDADGEFTNTSGSLTWENSSDSLVLNDSKNYFWFNASSSSPGWYNITATIINSSGGSLDINISVEVNDTTAPYAVYFSGPTPNSGDNLSATEIEANVSVADNGVVDSVMIYLYNSSQDEINASLETTAGDYYINFSDLSDGVYYLNATANDTAGNTNYSTTYSIILDTVGPGTVVLTEPQNGTISSATGFAVNVSAADSLVGVETIVLSLSNSTDLLDTNASSATSINLTYTDLPEGTYYINATANDTLGNSNTTAFTTVITLDTSYPEATFVSPGDYENRTVSNFTVNVTITDNNPDSVVLSVYNSTGSLLDTNTTTSGEEVSYISLSEDTYFINVTINDSAGNLNYSSRYVVVNAYPDVSLVSPSNNTQSSSAVQTFNCSATSSINLSSITLYIWNSSGSNISEPNITEVNGISNSTSWSHNLSSEGLYYWNCVVNDTLGNETWGSENQTLIIDQTAPEITLESPANSISSTTSSYNFTFNVSDSYDVANCSLIIDGDISSTSSNISTSLTNGIVKSSISVGSHTWSINCTDQAGNVNSSSSRTLTVSSSTTQTPPSGGGGGSPTYSVTQETFQKGYTRMLQRGWKLRFQIQEQSHTLELKKISGNEVTIEVKSDPQTSTLSLGEEKKFDVTDDNIYDFSVKLENLVGNSANITVQSLAQGVSSDSSSDIQTAEEVPEDTEPSEHSESIINSPDEAPPITSGGKSSIAPWVVVFILLIVVAGVLVILLEGKKKKRRERRKKKIFELYQF